MYLLITQTNNRELVTRLLSSIEHSLCKVVVVNHTTLKIQDPKIISIEIGKRISSSKSKNIALKFSKTQEWYSSISHILFPDDDCYYGNCFWSIFKPHDNQSYLTNIINEKKQILKWWKIGSLGYLKVMNSNLVISKNHLKYLFFDENLGVGTPNGSGEDLDIFWQVGPKNFKAEKNWHVHHPLNNSSELPIDKFNKLESYFRGHIVVCRKHRRVLPILYSLSYSLFLSILNPSKKNLKLLKSRISQYKSFSN